MRGLFLLILLMPITAPALAQRVNADVSCRPTPQALAYDCRIVLKHARNGTPVPGAELMVGADMPSMPMAHNVKPVPATPGKAPGEYDARIALEMHGEWALRLQVSGPVRDIVVKKLRFE